MSFRQGARQFFARRAAPTPPLPYDYAVEYIETDGVASYINTGITPVLSTSRIETEFQVISVPLPSLTTLLGNCIFGASSSPMVLNQRMTFVAQTGHSVFKTQSPNISSSSSPAYDNNKHKIEFGNSGLIFDGVLYSVTASSQTCENMCLGTRGEFPASKNPQNYHTQTRFFYFKMYSGADLVFDGIPVVANGLAGLYDSISGTVKTNAAATGTITAGPRI